VQINIVAEPFRIHPLRCYRCFSPWNWL